MTTSASPRILLWDIETSPNLGYVWGKFDQNVIAFDTEWHLLTIAWKWLGDKKVHVLGLDDFDRYKEDPEDDYELVKQAHALLSEADVVIAHNGISFDTKKTQARMIIHGFDPPIPFREVDTLKLARKHFNFTSNRLDDLCKALGIGRKTDTGGFQTWLGCLQGDAKAWAKMKKYNAHDVRILERLYLKLRPWATNHPNLATVSGQTSACPKCNSTSGMTVRGYRHTATARKVVLQCRSCKGYTSTRQNELVRPDYV